MLMTKPMAITLTTHSKMKIQVNTTSIFSWIGSQEETWSGLNLYSKSVEANKSEFSKMAKVTKFSNQFHSMSQTKVCLTGFWSVKQKIDVLEYKAGFSFPWL